MKKYFLHIVLMACAVFIIPPSFAEQKLNGFQYISNTYLKGWFNLDGINPSCASNNGVDCLWGYTAEDASIIDFDTLKPLYCGEDHRSKYGITGYDTAYHWCFKLKAISLYESIQDEDNWDLWEHNNSQIYVNTSNSDPACLSYGDGRSCRWNNAPDWTSNDTLVPLVCGEQHKVQWGITGYEDPNHWCSKLRGQNGIAKRLFQIVDHDADGRKTCLRESPYEKNKFIAGDCDLQDTSWFIYDGAAVRSAYSRTAYIKNVPQGTFNDPDIDGLGEYTFVSSVGSKSYNIQIETAFFVNSNLEKYASDLFLEGEKKTYFMTSKTRVISKLFHEMIENINDKAMIRSISEESGVPINNSVEPYELKDLMNVDLWRSAIANHSSAGANYSQRDIFLLNQLLGNIKKYSAKYASEIDHKHGHIAYEYFLKNTKIEDPTYEIITPSSTENEQSKEPTHEIITLSSTENEQSKEWSAKIFSLAYKKLENDYPHLLTLESGLVFSHDVAHETVASFRTSLGGGIMFPQETAFEGVNSASVAIYNKHFARYKTELLDGYIPFYSGLSAESRRAKVIFVASYIEILLGDSYLAIFEDAAIHNGAKAYDAASKIYPAILGAYAPGNGMGYHPDIQLALITRDLYRIYSVTQSSSLKNRIFDEQSGFSLAYKRYPYFYSEDKKMIHERARNLAQQFTSVERSSFGKLLAFVFTFDMVFGFYDLFLNAFTNTFEDAFAGGFNEAVIAEVESEEISIASEIES
ncbi:MAG: hypothetical protein KZQ70_13495, partial [gamma proteobacterium symbiont of Lucinoma myriamae]|nr:hypothetical protein [gamma proteobacterium symbiont of Lucinoma myriamae]